MNVVVTFGNIALAINIENKVTQFVKENVAIKKQLCEFSIVEMNYEHNPLIWAKEETKSNDLKKLIKTYLDQSIFE